MFWHVVSITSLLKVLTVQRTTETYDFHVHRNWLALTNTLPINQWYTDTTSAYPLDYLPLFACLEWVLSQFAPFFDPDMLIIAERTNNSNATRHFLMGSVVLLDLTMAFGIWVCSRALQLDKRSKSRLALFIFTNAGQYYVDYLNFHYSGISIGILLASLGYMLMGKCFKSAALFVLAINLNQTCLFLSPAYFIYLLTSYCDPWKQSPKKCLYNLSCLASIVITGFAVAFAPFVWLGQLAQVWKRIFPFERGLMHWPFFAPNAWTLYTWIDQMIGLIFKLFDHSYEIQTNPNLFADVRPVFTALPMITPLITNIVTLGMLVPILIKLWKSPKKNLQFLKAVVLCALTCFLFGW